MKNDQTPNPIATIYRRCWEDPAFKTRFLREPAAVMKEHGIELPDGVVLKVVENTDNIFHLVLPPAPLSPETELSEGELQQAAGGGRGALTFLPPSVAMYAQINPYVTVAPTARAPGGTHTPPGYCLTSPC